MKQLILLIRRLILMLIVFSTLRVSAQSNLIGKVTGDNNEALPGVSITVKGTSKGTTTDAEGNFKIEASAGTRLVFSFIGFETQELITDNATTLNVRMLSNVKALEELVVVGYGQVKKVILQRPFPVSKVLQSRSFQLLHWIRLCRDGFQVFRFRNLPPRQVEAFPYVSVGLILF